ncbi:hypothetical protein [Nonomuraea glycinis]|uniref:hypothetical protein n=1 Tax=Nonomuraea glycinis TaxID=2047744 RepID=UPI0033AA9EF8
MREPEPTPADQWSGWETEPKLPGYWPGLGYEQRQGGFEIDRKGVKAVSGGLIEMAVDADMNGTFDRYGNPAAIPNLHWQLPQALGHLLQGAGAVTRLVWNDLHAEVGMAGLLIERACARYDLADTPKLGDLPLSRLAERIPGADSKGPLGPGGQPSHLYPKDRHWLSLSGIDRGVDYMTAAKAVQDFGLSHDVGQSTFWLYGNVPEYFDSMANSLVQLANMLTYRAQDLRDSPWHGEAADMAQGALRHIYANVTSLAATAGRLDTAATRFAEITSWCAANFEKVVDPEKGIWDELWTIDSADDRTRKFLTEANDEFLEIDYMMPKCIVEDLPGLLVNDEMTTQLRTDVERMDALQAEQFNNDNHEWLVANSSLLERYEKAEQKYG